MVLIFGVGLIVIGLAILYFFRPERWAQFAGGVLIVLGLVLVVVGVVNVLDVDVDDADAAVQVARSSWGRVLAALRL